MRYIKLIFLGVLMVALGGLGMGQAAATSHGSETSGANSALVQIDVQPAATNGCHLPTAAGIGSGYSRSYSGCVNCALDAASATQGSSTTVYYCTYNPNNGLTDYHFGSTSSHCHLPTSAGPGSGYSRSSSNCETCAQWAAADTLSLGNPHIWYCTYNPNNGLTDEHWG
jgi:hypothetical protein